MTGRRAYARGFGGVAIFLLGCSKPAVPENEAYRMLTAIERGARNAFEESKRFCPSTLAPHLPGSTWADPAWQCLKVSSNEAHKFTYEYRSNGKQGADAECTAIATRRLDDGKVQTVTLIVRGKANGEVERVSLTTS
jgi:hypothetical protein